MSVFAQVQGGNFTNLYDLSQFQSYVHRITDKLGIYILSTMAFQEEIELSVT